MNSVRLMSKCKSGELYIYRSEHWLIFKCDGDTFRVPLKKFCVDLEIKRRDVPVII